MNIPEKQMEPNKSIFDANLPFYPVLDDQIRLSFKKLYFKLLTIQIATYQRECDVQSHNASVSCLR